MLNSVILEIWTGAGVLLEKLALRGEAVIGLDLSPGMLAETQARLRSKRMPVNLINGDATHIPLADACVDCIVTTFAFSAIPDGAGAMSEMTRVLLPGGLLALVDAGIPDERQLGGRGFGQSMGIVRRSDADEAVLMRRAGLTVVARREFGGV